MDMNRMKTIGSTIGKIALAFLLAFGLTLILTIPVLFVAGIVDGYRQNAAATLEELLNHPVFAYGSMIAQAAGFIGAAFLMRLWFERKAGWTMGWKQPGALRQGGRGALFGVVLMTAIFLLMWASGVLIVRGMRADSAIWTEFALYLLFFALVAWNEELFSRGYVYGLIRHRFGVLAAVIGSSALFALMHALNPGALANPLPLFNLFAAGVLLAVCRELTGGLWFPMGLHWTWNFVQGNVFGFEVSGTPVRSLIEIEPSGPAALSGGAFGAEGSILATLVMGAGLLYVWLGAKSGRGRTAFSGGTANNRGSDGQT